MNKLKKIQDYALLRTLLLKRDPPPQKLIRVKIQLLLPNERRCTVQKDSVIIITQRMNYVSKRTYIDFV